ncbi:MAG: hypothetical protein JWO53_9 [Chlamydiia bacterium]|nr:hypothetical protein [Chlamydiia bacterium]
MNTIIQYTLSNSTVPQQSNPNDISNKELEGMLVVLAGIPLTSFLFSQINKIQQIYKLPLPVREIAKLATAVALGALESITINAINNDSSLSTLFSILLPANYFLPHIFECILSNLPRGDNSNREGAANYSVRNNIPLTPPLRQSLVSPQVQQQSPEPAVQVRVPQPVAEPIAQQRPEPTTSPQIVIDVAPQENQRPVLREITIEPPRLPLIEIIEETKEEPSIQPTTPPIPQSPVKAPKNTQAKANNSKLLKLGVPPKSLKQKSKTPKSKNQRR